MAIPLGTRARGVLRLEGLPGGTPTPMPDVRLP